MNHKQLSASVTVNLLQNCKSHCSWRSLWLVLRFPVCSCNFLQRFEFLHYRLIHIYANNSSQTINDREDRSMIGETLCGFTPDSFGSENFRIGLNFCRSLMFIIHLHHSHGVRLYVLACRRSGGFIGKTLCVSPEGWVDWKCSVSTTVNLCCIKIVWIVNVSVNSSHQIKHRTVSVWLERVTK